MRARSPAPRSPQWNEVAEAEIALRARRTFELFDAEPQRFASYSASAAGLLLDYSRQHLDARARRALLALAQRADVAGVRDAMYRGEIVNLTEGRAALHVALRQPRGCGLGGPEIERVVLAERDHMLDFAERVRDGRVAGSNGRRIRDVINIGIGGSDLGPAMACEALRNFGGEGPRVRFVSNVDGCALMDALRDCAPEETLFIVASKTFTTQETMANARSARAWVVEKLGTSAVPRHFGAVSVNAQAMDAFGIAPQYRFTMWDWVGGRYSLWSSIGVGLAIAIGARHFQALLAGAHAMDLHFRDAPPNRNLPLLAALLGVWNINFRSLPTHAVLPYDSRLARLPAYLQQLEMESNGKSVTADGERLQWQTAPVIWGEPGNNAQHSFFQLLHQGTARAALDMLLGVESSCGAPEHQELAIANCLAQAEAFMRGQQASDLPAWKIHDGDRPVSVLLFDRLDPATLGAVLALYEHKVFAQSVIWGINAFDQWGVELGKRVASSVLEALRATGGSSDPSSLRGLLSEIRARRAR